MRTFSVQTLGCKVNQYEGEQLAALLRSRGLRAAELGREEQADLRVINTCSVTVQAAAKSRQLARRAGQGASRIGETRLSLPQLRMPHPTTAFELFNPDGPMPTDPTDTTDRPRVVVTGCWATSDKAEAAALPGVDAVIGHHQDVAAELLRLLDLWQGELSGPIHSTTHDAAPQPLGNEEWINQAGSPAGNLTHRITPFSFGTVNEKMGPEGPGSEGSGEKPAPRPPPASPRGTTSLPLLSQRQPGRQRAHLKVQDGCDAHCTYCIIPRLRPALWSKPIHDAVAEATRLVEAGHVEIVLTGIFLGAYGRRTALRRRRADNPAGSVAPLIELVDALCGRVPGLRRLRFSSLEPGDLTDELVAALRAHPQVVPHFHLPLQSGSDALLRRMNRQYTRDDYLRMINRVRSAFDRPALTTDIIVGFPGETDAEFERTREVVELARFIHVHAFSFSPRPGTAAARWTGQFVRGPIVNERIELLRRRAEAHNFAFRQQFVGQFVQLLVEREQEDDAPGAGADAKADGGTDAGAEERGDAGVLGYPPTRLRHGRCERYFAVHFEGPSARPGDLACVRIDRVLPDRTFGVRVG